MINNHRKNISKLFQSLQLGDLSEEPTEIIGGLLHKMYKVNTEKSAYAVKHLNPLIMKRKPAKNHIIMSEKFARYAFDHGINAVPAIVINNQVLHKFQDQYYLIFPWIKGESGEKVSIENTMCKKIGNLLASLHELNYDQITLDHSSHEPIDWDPFLSLAKKQNVIWLDDFKDEKEFLQTIEEKTNTALEENKSNIVSHRDFDPKNIMWDDQMNPIIIDWESAGPINDHVELLDVALYWSENGRQKDAFQSVIMAYKEVREADSRDLSKALYCIVDGKLKWLEYNMKRSLGIESSHEEERLLGTKEVVSTLESILRYVRHLPIIEAAIMELI